MWVDRIRTAEVVVLVVDQVVDRVDGKFAFVGGRFRHGSSG
jgi:hypothetical protein